MDKERRVFERYPCSILGSYADSNNKSLGIKCHDISGSGVGLAGTEHLPVNTYLQINLCTKAKKEPLLVRGIVRWCSKAPDEWRAGVEFSKRILFPLAMVV